MAHHGESFTLPSFFTIRFLAASLPSPRPGLSTHQEDRRLSAPIRERPAQHQGADKSWKDCCWFHSPGHRLYTKYHHGGDLSPSPPTHTALLLTSFSPVQLRNKVISCLRSHHLNRSNSMPAYWFLFNTLLTLHSVDIISHCCLLLVTGLFLHNLL